MGRQRDDIDPSSTPTDPQVRELIAELVEKIGGHAGHCFTAANRQPARSKARGATWNVQGDAYSHAAVMVRGQLDALLTRPVPQPDLPPTWKCLFCGYQEYILGGDFEWERAIRRRHDHEVQCNKRPNELAASRPDGEARSEK